MWFRAFIRGENFLMEVNGKLSRYGFYTTRFVEASDSSGAEIAAVTAIKKDPKLWDTVRNPKNDSPMIYVEEIIPIDSSDSKAVAAGFTFYES